MLGAQEIRELATKIDLIPDKRRGQNFVLDPNTISRIVNISGVNASDVVLEIGPGFGSLTIGLLDTGARVIAVEVDKRLAELLPLTAAKHSAGGQLAVICRDAMESLDLPELPNRLVANLPYNLAVPIFLGILQRVPSIETALIMVQLEVAERLVAAPSQHSYGVPSAKVGWYGRAEMAGKVSRSVFWPVPNVDSALVRFTRHSSTGSEELRERCFKLIDLAFSQRRKTLRKSLENIFGTAAAVERALTKLNLSTDSRGEQLSIHQFADLAAQLS